MPDGECAADSWQNLHKTFPSLQKCQEWCHSSCIMITSPHILASLHWLPVFWNWFIHIAVDLQGPVWLSSSPAGSRRSSDEMFQGRDWRAEVTGPLLSGPRPSGAVHLRILFVNHLLIHSVTHQLLLECFSFSFFAVMFIFFPFLLQLLLNYVVLFLISIL